MNERQSTYQQIYSHGEDLLRDHGVAFAFEHLERRVGIGSGGLRHHFPRKEDLIAAHAQGLFRKSDLTPESLLERSDLGAAVNEWAYHVVELLPNIHGLADLLIKAVRREESALHALATSVIAETTPLLERARSQGLLKTEVMNEEFVITKFSAAATSDALEPGRPFRKSGRAPSSGAYVSGNLPKWCIYRSPTIIMAPRLSVPT